MVGAVTNRSLSVFNFCAIISVETLPRVCSGKWKKSNEIKHHEVREVMRERKGNSGVEDEINSR